MNNRNILLGCVGDDFTGASDAASFLRSCGLRVILCTGIPDNLTNFHDCDAIVIALKTRSVPAEEAVKDCICAFKFLLSVGAKQLYYKYCSTFDSTPKGNIGPVLDAVLCEFNEKYTILCPALPVNGRTVKDGHLYVDGIPLHETHMKNHPVNPMWDSEIAALMREQSKYPCYSISTEDMAKGKEHVNNLISDFSRISDHFYIVPDYYEEKHSDLIYSIFGDLKVLSGGSGLLEAVNVGGIMHSAEKLSDTAHCGKTVLLAGSCSKMTLAQIEAYKKCWSGIKIDPIEAFNNVVTAQSLWEQIKFNDRVLLYSSETADEIKRIPDNIRPLISEKLEILMSELAMIAVANGYTQIIVAGGETSGAVAKALSYGTCKIGKSVAPGVPVMIPVDDPDIRLVLKSGNFGKEDFFERAVEMTTQGNRGI